MKGLKKIINKEPQKSTIKHFLTGLYGDSPGYLGIWTQADKSTRFFQYTEIDQAAEYALSRCQETNIYYNIGLQKELPASGSRGQAKEVLVIPGLWLDVDLAGGSHKAENLPEEDKARVLLDEFPIPPTLIVHTGGGWHCYWQANSPLLLGTQELHQQAAGLLQQFQKAFIHHFSHHGYKLDNTSDLARLLRLPGTLNYKSDPPTEVKILAELDARYTWEELESAVTDFALDVSPNLPSEGHSSEAQASRNPAEDSFDADPDLILEGCNFIRHCRDEAGTLEEPAWYAMLTNMARTAGGIALCHQLSKPFPGYVYKETETKIRHALADSGPVTCKKLRSDFPKICDGCQYNVTSPIVLGSVGSWEDPIPLRTHAAPPFPLDVLPKWLGEFVETVATATQTPADMAAMLALTIVGACGAKIYKVSPRPGWMEPLNIYTLTIMDPGNRKSAVMSEMTSPLQEYEHALVEAEESTYRAGKAKRDAIEQALSIAKSSYASAKAGKAKGNGPTTAELEANIEELSLELADMPEPHRPRLLCDDITVEKLAGIMAEQGGPMALFSAEGGFINTLGGRYSQGQSNFDLILKAHNGEVVRVDRVGREPDFIKNPALSLGLAVQPEILKDLTAKREFRGKGLSARFLYCIPSSYIGKRAIDPAPVPDEVRSRFKSYIKQMLGVSFPMQDPDSSETEVITLQEGARTVLKHFEAFLEPQLARGGLLGNIQDWASKLAGAVVRIAGIIHISENIDGYMLHMKKITPQTMMGAVKVGNYLIEHAKIAFDIMGTNEDLELAQDVLNWINTEGKKSFTRRDIYSALHNNFQKATQVDAPLNILIDHGYIKECAAKRKDQRIFLVNPHNPVAVVAVHFETLGQQALAMNSEEESDGYEDDEPY